MTFSFMLAMLVCSRIFCAEALPDSDDRIVHDRKNTRRKRTKSIKYGDMSEKVLKCLETSKVCDKSQLLDFWPNDHNDRKNLNKVILDLRFKGHNISYDVNRKTYTLNPGVWLIEHHDFERKLWEKFENPSALKRTNWDLTMELSEEHYNPSFFVVSALKTLKKFMLNTQEYGKAFVRRRTLWSQVLQEGGVERFVRMAQDHEIAQPDGQFLHHCWDFYKKNLKRGRDKDQENASLPPRKVQRLSLSRIAPESGRVIGERIECAASVYTLDATGGDAEVGHVGKNNVSRNFLAQRRQNVLSELKKHAGMYCTEQDLLRKFYGEDGKADSVCEDVLKLINAGNNILFSETSYSFSLDPMLPVPKDDAKKVFLSYMHNKDFSHGSVLYKTQSLYMAGYRNIPLSTVALYAILVCGKQGIFWSVDEEKIDSMVVVKDAVLQGIPLHSLQTEVPITKDDWASIKKSMRLYEEGRKFCKENFPFRGKEDGRFWRLLQHLSDHACERCSERDLYPLVQATCFNNYRRDLYQTIVRLRESGHNIIFDCAKRTLTLCPGKRRIAVGCYKKFLWKRLWDDTEWHPIHLDLFIDLSSRGFNPLFNTVKQIFDLKKLFYAIHPKRDEGDLIIKKKLWNVVCQQKGVLHNAPYYVLHPQIYMPVTPKIVKAIKSFWALYKEVTDGHFNNPWDKQSAGPVPLDSMVQKVKELLESSSQGVLLEDIDKMSTNTGEEKVCGWTYIRDLMAGGYAENVAYDPTQKKFFWQKSTKVVVEKSTGLHKTLRSIPAHYTHDTAIFYLYKKGHFCVTPEDIPNLFAVLTIAGRCPKGFELLDVRQVWGRFKDSGQNFSVVPPHMTSLMELALALEYSGVLRDIADEKPVEIERILLQNFTADAPCLRQLETTDVCETQPPMEVREGTDHGPDSAKSPKDVSDAGIAALPGGSVEDVQMGVDKTIFSMPYSQEDATGDDLAEFDKYLDGSGEGTAFVPQPEEGHLPDLTADDVLKVLPDLSSVEAEISNDVVFGERVEDMFSFSQHTGYQGFHMGDHSIYGGYSGVALPIDPPYYFGGDVV